MKQKRVVKSKQEVIAELKKNAVAMASLTFIKEKFYPALLEASVSVSDAKQLLSGFNTTVMQTFLESMKDMRLKDLKLEDKLDKESKKYEQMKTLLAVFDEMNVFEAKGHIENMRAEIEKFEMDEMEGRPLSSLQTKWLDEI